MKNKKQLVVHNLDDDTIKNEDADAEIVDEKTCEVEYDTTTMQTFAIDGVLPYFDKEESRLVFFTNISSVGDVNYRVKKFHNVCVVELRITPSCMKRIFSIIYGEMIKNKQHELKEFAMEKGLIKQEHKDQIMYT
jgi:hypothetical protein